MSVIPEWLKKGEEFLRPEAKDAKDWLSRNQHQFDAITTNCAFCNEFRQIDRPNPPKGQPKYGVSYCPDCKIGYWFEIK